MAQNSFELDKVIARMEQVKRDLPKALANDAQRFFNERFVKQDWDGVPWQTPKRKIPGTKEWKYPIKGAEARRSRAILTGRGISRTGHLRRNVADSLETISFNEIRFNVKSPYAAIHNYGLKMARGGTMPKRQFMGDSKILRQKLQKKIETAVNKIWQG